VITLIIFSKDRPLQLDLSLNSIQKNFIDCNQKIVIYNNSEAYTEAHEILKSEHQDVEFWQQGRSLFEDVFQAVSSADNDYVCFFTDDNIFYSKFQIRDFDFWFEEVCTLSLRMGENVTERLFDGRIIPDPSEVIYSIDEYDLLGWPKTFHRYGSYWSYSLSVDGHVFKRDDIVQMMDELCLLDSRYKWHQTPNQLETALQRFWATSPNLMVSPKKSVVVNSPNNRVQNTHYHNLSGNEYEHLPEDLLDRYLLGARINLELLDFNDIKCPHTEIDLIKGLA